MLAIVAATLALSLLWPVASGLFRFGPLHPGDLAVTVGAGAIVLVVLELLKPYWQALFKHRANA